MKLNKRLTFIASLVKKDAILVDIGTDHGYLPTYLLLNNKIKFAYALDINKLPLQSAYDTFSKYDLLDKTECILSNGLMDFKANDFNSIVIAGMGGTLMIDIINNDLDSFNNVDEFILQPQNNSYGLRKFLLSNNFNIINENIVIDSTISYEIMKVSKNKDGNDLLSYNELELMYGRLNLDYNKQLVVLRMEDDLTKYQRIMKQLNKTHDKYHEVQAKIALIRGYLNGIK